MWEYPLTGASQGILYVKYTVWFIVYGETTTQIRYVNETNPYQKDLKEADKSKYQGANVDIDAG